MNAATRDSDKVEAWAKYIMFTKCVFRKDKLRGGKRRRRQDQSKGIKSRLARWVDGDILSSLWDDVKQAATARQRTPPKPMTDESRLNRVKELAQEGRLSKAAAGLTAEGVAPYSEEILAALKAKHPQAEEPWVPDGKPPDSIQFDNEQLKRAIFSFSPGTAGGGSGMLAQHM